ncbi:hypothetical protein, conserved in P.knowlesi [Plasmodium knowlesi strain H]|uniref:Uncharacterized protein n=3 Tax=Plasmodium knowlesi TaxID=5850 RepID=A0A5K1VU62_PLAKH|nr:uncharacterized protein PKNH_1000800 [Plasmodium knowlesi strain H]OTN67203.1 Uncharacterized protein PKNOH_S07438400 [Plasmodium knowlesi]CAA9988519.1 hypothetical protein, conserved in P.knowlesi [Plasmodium knowlesi strain H]SBO21286.1 hypothetical protein, conserved in P.knowlesi [Plasmodium knowlesi strain H]SBO21740.1 hypothetical protein, conserved in P.knowlesi [Plasmodium knowlesi strain H]VVS77993.1 hypothetical protein, conserved in P.knowlesi [Plasmodium knowlesi strain H]|eukprot:XP_002259494.1 [Plasmodium knowlesi strain H]
MYYVRRIITINALLVLQCTAVVASDTGSGDVVKTVVEGLKTGWKTYTDLFKNLCQQMVGSATEKSGNDAAGLGINVCDNSIAITLLLGIVSAIWGSFQFLCRLWCINCCANCCRRRPRRTKMPKQIVYHVGYKPGEKTPKQDLYQEVCHESEKDLGPPSSASSPSSCSTSSQSSPSQAPESEQEQPESGQSGKRERVKGRREQRMEKALKGKKKR